MDYHRVEHHRPISSWSDLTVRSAVPSMMWNFVTIENNIADIVRVKRVVERFLRFSSAEFLLLRCPWEAFRPSIGATN